MKKGGGCPLTRPPFFMLLILSKLSADGRVYLPFFIIADRYWLCFFTAVSMRPGLVVFVLFHLFYTFRTVPVCLLDGKHKTFCHTSCNILLI